MSRSAPCAPSNSSDCPLARADLQQRGDVGHHRLELRGERERVVARLRERHGVALEIFRQHEVVELEHRLELRGEALGIEEVLHADRAARDLVFVRRPDAAACRADLRVAHRALARLVEGDVVRKDQRARRRELQPRTHLDAGAFELADLLQQRRRRDDDAVADVDRDAGPQDSGGNEPQHGLLAADDERVARIVPALEAHDAVGVLGQPVDDLAFAFIAPLGADDDDVLAHQEAPVSRATMPASCRRSSVKPVAGRARPNALPMPS